MQGPKQNRKNNERVNWRVRDFCDAHGIGRTTLYEEIKRGELSVIKIGKRTLISDVEAKAWQARKEGKLANG